MPSVSSSSTRSPLDEHGRLLYPEQVYACPKKSGKTGFAGLHMLTTILLFGGHLPRATRLPTTRSRRQPRVRRDPQHSPGEPAVEARGEDHGRQDRVPALLQRDDLHGGEQLRHGGRKQSDNQRVR